MINVLLVYDRAAGQLIEEQTFDSRDDALRARFATEKRYRGQEGRVEVVALEAASWEALLQTHGRYFRSLSELASALDELRVEVRTEPPEVAGD